MAAGHGTLATPARDERRSSAQVDHAVRQMMAEYSEMPGLKLTTAQAQRLWSLDPATCAAALAALTRQGVVRRTPGGSYVARRVA